MKKYNVAIITNIPTPYRIALFEKIDKVPSLNLCVYFTTVSKQNKKWDVQLNNKFKYKFLRGFILKYQSDELFSYHINPSIFQELLKNDYDIVIAAGYDSFATQISSVLCKIRDIRFIIWSGSTIHEPSLIRKISSPLTRFMVKHSDAFITYGTKAKEYINSIGAPLEEIFIAYNTVDTEFFKEESFELKGKKSELKSRIGIKNEMIVIYVGQLIKRKNVGSLLRSYSKLKDELDVALLIVGDGILKNDLKKVCIKENICDVFFVGYKQIQELSQYYAMSDVFVLPSWQEVWGLVLNEAMASGLPVITTNKAGSSVDLIKDGVNGYIVEAKNTEQFTTRLYEVMKKILSVPGLKESMGKKSQDIIEESYTIRHAVKNFMSAINYVNKQSK